MKQNLIKKPLYFFKTFFLKLKKFYKIPFKKRGFYPLRKKPNSGQSILEYILFLSLSTFMILGMVYQINKAFSVWANNYFGDYLACLLEMGELPALGGTPNIKSSTCDSQYHAFSIADGRPLIKGQGLTDSSSGLESEDQETNKTSGSKNKKKGKSKNNQNSSSTSSNQSQSQEASMTSADELNQSDLVPSHQRHYGKNNKASKGRTKKIKKKAPSKKKDSEDLKTLNVGSNNKSGRNGQIPLSDEDVFIYGGLEEEEEEEEEEENKVIEKKKKIEKARQGVLIREKPILITKKKKSSAKQIEIEPLTFGGFFRYLVIAGIVIGLLTLIGGQFVQIKDSLK